MGEIHNPTNQEDQVVDWFLLLPEIGVTLRGQPGRPNLLPGAPWWPHTPFDLAARKMTRGAVFFPGEEAWRSAFPREPLRGRLVAHLFLGQKIEQTVEIYTISTLNERAKSTATMPSIRLRHEQPANERDFEILCLRLLRKHWSCPTLELYGHRGERQHGVDILDTGGAELLRAAQCKLHDRTKALSIAEIRQEVNRAKGFRPKLSVYVILTTAKVSAAAQEELIRINEEHRTQGLFEVRLVTWDALEILLDENPDVLSVTYGTPNETSAGRFPGSVLSLGSVPEQSPQPPIANSLDGEIEEARAYLLRGDYQVARLLLQRLRLQKWDILSPRQKFRVASNIAAAYLAEGSTKDAIPLFLEAKSYQPDEERAWANEVLAYILAGNIDQAFARATEARKKFPHSGVILGHWLRTAPLDQSLEQLKKEIPPVLESDPDVCITLAQRALNALEFDSAEKLAQLAAERRPDWPHPRILFAQAILRKELAKVQWDSDLAPICDKGRLRHAEIELTKAIEQANPEGASDIKAEALLLRAEVRKALGDSANADQDVRTVWGILPKDPSVLRDHARLMLADGHRERGVSELRQALAASERREDIALFLAVTLRAGTDPAERQEALQLLTEVAERKNVQPEGFRERVIWTALEALAEEGRTGEGLEFLSRIPKESISKMASATFRARLSLLQGNREESFKHADEAIALVADFSKPEDIRILGHQLSELGRYKDALPLWQRIASRTSLTSDTRRLIDCASRLKRHDVILSVCRDLRSSGFEDEDLLSHEVSILQSYDPEAAVSILQEYLAHHPQARLIRLQLSALGLQLDRKDLIAASIDMLPRPEDVPPPNWPLVVRVMIEGGNANGAVEYAYDLLRGHFSEPDAHRAYLAAFLPMQNRPDIPALQEAGPGAAVCFVEMGAGQEQWLVIEDSHKPDKTLNEIAPDHSLATELKGKRQGDTFALAGSGISKRSATIKQIMSKYIYRYQDCLTYWQVRFPTVPGIEMVRVLPKSGSDGEDLDISPILSMVDEREKTEERLLNAYASQAVPLHIFGASFGQNAFEAICHLATKPSAKIKCCLGSPLERSQALEALRVAKGMVLDLTAIATVATLDVLKILENRFVPLVVSRSTVLDLEQLANAEAEKPKESGFLGKQGGRYVLLEDSDAEQRRRVKRFRELLDVLNKSCQVVVCPGLAGLDPEKREILTKAFGQHGAESILLASEPGRVLWTDDSVLAGLAQKEFGVRRVWTQVYLQALAEAGAIDPQAFFDATAKLAGCGYYFTSMNIASMLAAHSLASGDPKGWPLKQVLESFEDEAISSRDSLSLFAQYLAQVFKEGIGSHQEDILVQILDHLGNRTSGTALVRALRQILPPIMGLNVIGATRAETIIASWLAYREKGPGLI